MKVKGKIVDSGFRAFNNEPFTHAGHHIPRIWVVIADRKKAHIYRKTTDGLERIAEAKADGKESFVVGAEKTHGHVHTASGNVRYCSDPRDREHRHDDMTFIYGIAAWLDEAVRENAFDRIVLVAAPRTLGDLRTVLSKPVHARVMAEVSKELTKMPQNKLQEELAEIVWF
jgi:protein required for attachment to host cells